MANDKNTGMVSMLKKTIRYFSLGFMLPATFMIIMYAGVGSTYTWGGYFTEKHFHDLYDNGIYKYRLLGKQSLLEFYALTKAEKLPGFVPKTVIGAYKGADKNLYAAYFYNNTIFFIIASCILISVFNRANSDSFFSCELPVLSILGLIALTQYIVVPYDTLTYACLFAAIYLTIDEKHNKFNVLALCLIMMIATLTRESSAIIISFYTAWHWTKISQMPVSSINKHQWGLIAIICTFIATYFGLRLELGFSQGLFHEITINRNINISFYLALLFFVSILSLFFLSEENSDICKRFLFFSLPYAVMITIVAIPQELRLWMPIILPLIIIKALPVMTDK